MYLRLGIHVNIPFDAADAPEVLTLQIVAVGETMHLYGYHVFSSSGKGGDVEAGRGFGVFVHAHEFPVEVVESCSAYSVGAEEDFFVIPVGRQREGATIGSRRVPLFGNVGRIGLVPVGGVAGGTELVRLVDVDRRAEASQFPVAGNVDVGPFAYVCMGRHKVGRAVGEVLYIVEFPLPVEGDAECPVLAVVDDGICFVRIGGERAAGLLFVDTCQPGIGDLRIPVFLCHEGERKTGGCNQ